MANILLLYSTTDGHTRKICQRLQSVIASREHRVELRAIDDVADIQLAAFDTIVIGASIRYGRHAPKVYEFIAANQALLEAKANAFFTVNVVARKAAKNTPETNPYLKKFLRQIAWRPKRLAVFAGKLDYPSYGFWDRSIIRLIMLLTGGPTDPQTCIEFTDWQQVEAFGELLAGS